MKRAALRDARAFADRMNRMLNATVSDGRLILTDEDCLEGELDLKSSTVGRPAPLRLRASKLTLKVSQRLDVRGNRCRTKSYRYRLQENDDAKSWLVRWEYMREPPDPDYRYPLAHAHVNATFHDVRAELRLAKTLAHLHLPTERVPLENVVRHAIEEWGVGARERDWRTRLDVSAAGWRIGARGG